MEMSMKYIITSMSVLTDQELADLPLTGRPRTSNCERDVARGRLAPRGALTVDTDSSCFAVYSICYMHMPNLQLTPILYRPTKLQTYLLALYFMTDHFLVVLA